MEKVLEILIKLSPLVLVWTIWNYFLQRKHKKKDKQNEEVRNVLLELLNIFNEINTLVNEIMFKTDKAIHIVQKRIEDLDSDSIVENFQNEIIHADKMLAADILNFEKTILNDLLNVYTSEDLANLIAKLKDHSKMLGTINREFTDLKQPSKYFTERFETFLQKLNLVNISIIDDQSQIKEKLNSLSELIQDYILISIKENFVINSKLAYIAVCGTSLSTMVSKQLKQL